MRRALSATLLSKEQAPDSTYVTLDPSHLHPQPSSLLSICSVELPSGRLFFEAPTLPMKPGCQIYASGQKFGFRAGPTGFGISSQLLDLPWRAFSTISENAQTSSDFPSVPTSIKNTPSRRRWVASDGYGCLYHGV